MSAFDAATLALNLLPNSQNIPIYEWLQKLYASAPRQSSYIPL